MNKVYLVDDRFYEFRYEGYRYITSKNLSGIIVLGGTMNQMSASIELDEESAKSVICRFKLLGVTRLW